MTFRGRILRFWRAAGSLDLTVIVLVGMMVLVFWGTLQQVHMGTWLAQKKFFSSWVVFLEMENARWPVFPGGFSLGALWLVNLTAAYTTRARWEWRNAGLLLTHVGLFALVLGQGLTQMWARESQMSIEVGQTAHYSEDSRASELAVVDTTASDADVVHSIPTTLLAQGGDISHPQLPFSIRVKSFYWNAVLRKTGAGPVTMGAGTGWTASELPRVSADDEVDRTTAIIDIVSEGKSEGQWLVAMGFPDQTFSHQGKSYRLSLRSTRRYVPFSLTLKKFTHERYPGTEIPKNFASLLHLRDPERGEDRDVLVYMNHPLRYRGLTFYQASFGKGDTLSVLQVVENPVWVAPYLGCLLVSLGLAWHFMAHMVQFRRRGA